MFKKSPLKPLKTLVFIDYPCPDCQGAGCVNCGHWGLRGYSEKRFYEPLPLQTPWANAFKLALIKEAMLLADLYKKTGIAASRLSSLRLSKEHPSDDERQKIQEALPELLKFLKDPAGLKEVFYNDVHQ